MRRNRWFYAILIIVGLAIFGSPAVLPGASVLAQTKTPPPQPTAVSTLDPNYIHDQTNSNCMMCHANPDFHGSFENGESLSLFVNQKDLNNSVHGDGGLKCEACHTKEKAYPHTDNKQVSCLECHDSEGGSMTTKFKSLTVIMPYPDKRAMVLEINENCRNCHEDEFQRTIGSAHEKVFESGNENAPQCVDCHGGHDMSKPGTPRTVVMEICGKCHAAVYSSFKVSVHGETIMSDNTNTDVPTCINCHGVHNVRGPRQITFRGDSVVVCGNCHKDQTMMDKYGLSTKVFDTYINDYHGRTVSLFQEAGKLSSNKATCFDCHGIHNIRRPEDSLSSVYPDNLQNTCQQCHTDATIRFPTAWLSHVEISWEKTPALFGIQAIYSWAIIPGTLGSFAIYIVLDARRRWLDKRKTEQEILSDEDLDEYDFEK